MKMMFRRLAIGATACAWLMSGGARPAAAQEVPAEYQAVLKSLGKGGDYKDSVLKVNIPRSDVRVTIAGRPAPTPFGFGGWIALTKGDGGHEVMMGDLVLTEDEVNPVMSALLSTGLDGPSTTTSFGTRRRCTTCTCTAWARPQTSPGVSSRRFGTTAP